jgi:glutaconate CoA-transferase subunit A
LSVDGDPDTLAAFLEKHIYGVKDFNDYLETIGGLSRLQQLRTQENLVEK